MSEELIPDFDDMTNMATNAARAKAKIVVIKAELAKLEATCIKEAMTQKDFWIGGKRPTGQYCNDVVKILGNTKIEERNLSILRIDLAEEIEKLHLLSELLQIQKSRLDLYRTKCANERKGFLS